MSNILVVGATSRIAETIAREFARRGDALCLLGRNMNQLQAVAADLRVRGAKEVHIVAFDAGIPDQFAPALEQSWSLLQRFDIALISHGYLGSQQTCIDSPDEIRQVMQVNATSTMEIGESIAGRLLRQGGGTLAIISSVAGERGRESNYAYGAAKAAVIAFCSGLRQRVARQGVRVVTILLGPVATPMTAEMKKGLLFSTPESIVSRLVHAIDSGKSVVYAPWYWRPIMQVIRHVPESLFMRFGPK